MERRQRYSHHLLLKQVVHRRRLKPKRRKQKELTLRKQHCLPREKPMTHVLQLDSRSRTQLERIQL